MAEPSSTAAANLIKIYHSQTLILFNIIMLRKSNAWTGTQLDGGCQPHYITSVHQCQTPILFDIIMLKTE